jgi:short subunit dehydrogenase-like uncharacterized protein
MADRDFDVVLFGATGFTGRLVAERLVERAPAGMRIALAGRSLAKLATVRESLGPDAAEWPLMLVDSGDRATLVKMARAATAVATTVGPYAKYGLPVVEACANAGTHYVDLTGEVLFMRASADAYDAAARASGARIVHACGFDSIPSDLGVLILNEVAGGLGETTLLVTDMRGGMSGGTLATGRVQAEAMAANPSARDIVLDPYSLSPDRAQEPEVGEHGDVSGPVHDPELGWLAPFFMASTNTRVVRRSNALAGYPYSREFRYREAMAFGEGVTARAKAMGVSTGLGAMGAAMGFGPARAGIGKVLPKPGEGPSAEERAAGRFRMDIHGTSLEDQRYVATVAAQGDPGYAATSLMLAESVLLAASDDPGLPDRAGVLTPATGFGLTLVERLRAAGMTFDAGIWDPQAAVESAEAGESEEAGESGEAGQSK